VAEGRDKVTRREAEVLSLITAHYNNSDISEMLGISKRTVESHISALLRKFAARDRAALVRSATAVDPSSPRRGRVLGQRHVMVSRRARSSALHTRSRLLRERNQQCSAALAVELGASIRQYDALVHRLQQAEALLCDRSLLGTGHASDASSAAAAAHRDADAARALARLTQQRVDRLIDRLHGIPPEARPAPPAAS
jgi:DNA-binding CsgD family transcriptional regulator